MEISKKAPSNSRAKIKKKSKTAARQARSLTFQSWRNSSSPIPHFTDEATEAQKKQASTMTCPRSYIQLVAEHTLESTNVWSQTQVTSFRLNKSTGSETY